MTSTAFTLTPIGHISTPFPDKFGIPRQPRLAPHARGILRLDAPYARPEAVRGLDAFSHVWLSWVFHQTAGQWSPTVRPPRLGGNQRVGVFASRSPFRPNPLGLSLVELLDIDTRDGVALTFGGIDLVDGTPILDIKPYIPFVESQPQARGGFVDGPPAELPVIFAPAAELTLATLHSRHPELRELIREVLAQDPRPAYADDAQRQYGVRLYTLDVKWRCTEQGALVEEIIPA
ncbi:tRNA (N6-threonylcarbamoyladenosine(37)-N6)-methyltransferase TrmO [Chitinilyticum piscinae]|uniref:tRNA (N6-threonylcarbamoyladenosine(37)-N6)-methyltransferase TrmO n=1 Tax=Chitinilyticum piscinae TaxID=2866724 RepID=A0A8J7FL83_9NEIS|nr:tRNA (N6-threonylcarbamoyladenosine(37)-N6)-methyltransferase TrmO [Chitinilyticum piscinae]MBE9609882.1 tRNA (N6-threonylcarbamoyladenosine(37)-N6)-methyltransferase TrmO [Chitinilyticum piscinae]